MGCQQIVLCSNQGCLIGFIDANISLRRAKRFLTTYIRVRTITQKKFMLSVTETNNGLAYDRNVKVSFESFYDAIFVPIVTKTLLKHNPQKSVF